MKRLILYIILLPLSSFAQFQTGRDSLYSSYLAEKERVIAYSSATQLLAFPVKFAANAGLSAYSRKGNFHKGQEAEKDASANFYTEGIETLGKFRLAGTFSIRRTWQDSLAWTAKGTELDAQPYYFGSSKAGEYQRQNYTLTGILAYEFIKDKVYLSSGIEYMFNNSTRNVDPRPSVRTFSIKLKPELTLKVRKQLVGISALFGYGDENIRLGYTNDNYRGNQGYPSRINYLLSGYGLLTIRTSDRVSVLNKENSYSGMGFSYASGMDNTKSVFRASLTYSRWKEESAYPIESSLADTDVGSFDMDSWRFSSVFRTTTERNTIHQFYLDMQRNDGSDFNASVNGSNYSYLEQDVRAGYTLRKKAAMNTELEAGAGFSFETLEKNDILSAHHVENQVLEPNLLIALYKRFSQSGRLSLSLRPALRIPIQQQISVPATQENVFTRGVVYPDYYYRSSRAVLFQGTAGYISPNIFKEFNTGMSLSVDYAKALNTASQQLASDFFPDEYRLQFKLGFNLYF